MGELIVLADRLADRSRPLVQGPPAFFFDLACPFSYLAAEQVERVLGEVDWVPTAAASMHGGADWARSPEVRDRAERLAAELRVPLVWPESLGRGAPTALRAASCAAEHGAGAQFTLAASRLAFCGGFDLEDPETLAEAAAAASLPLEQCLAAAADDSRDEALHVTARGLLTRGITELPAVRVERQLLSGDRAVMQGGELLRWRSRTGRLRASGR